MSGETNLDTLLANLQPELLDGEFIFCSADEGDVDIGRLKPLATFREAEGLSLVLDAQAAAGLGLDTKTGPRFKGILLSVYSSLEAVGLTAAISAALAEHDISANVIAAYHHDYVFVKSDDAEAAMAVLKQLALRHRNDVV